MMRTISFGCSLQPLPWPDRFCHAQGLSLKGWWMTFRQTGTGRPLFLSTWILYCPGWNNIWCCLAGPESFWDVRNSSIVLPSLRSKPESGRSGSEQLNVSLVLILVLVLAVSKIYIININFASSHMKFDSIWHNSYIFISCNPFVKLIIPGLFVVFALFLSEMNLNTVAMTVFRF